MARVMVLLTLPLFAMISNEGGTVEEYNMASLSAVRARSNNLVPHDTRIATEACGRQHDTPAPRSHDVQTAFI